MTKTSVHSSVNRFLRKGKAALLAYDQGFEHGPTQDFDLNSVDPDYVLDIAEKAKFTGFISHIGVAEHYWRHRRHKIPLMVKLNGKTKLLGGEPLSRQLCSVKRAAAVGAAGVGYTVYIGSEHESIMLPEAARIIEEAHELDLAAALWMYPRGTGALDPNSTEIIAYGARLALELGADFVKLPFNNDVAGLKWIVKSAGRCNVLIQGGSKIGLTEIVQKLGAAMSAGAKGVAIGRNVWQDHKPMVVAKAVMKEVF